MAWVGAFIAVLLIGGILLDAFEVVILPRRVRHSFRLARHFYRTAWIFWRWLARLLPSGKWRQAHLSVFGPLSLIVLLALWAAGLVLGFAFLHWSLNTALSGEDSSFPTYVYFSGTTFFTLGYGDVVPRGAWGRALSVAESGLGFGFLALVLSYLPVLHQAFSRREIAISLLDARAGSPPCAGELLRRLADCTQQASTAPFLQEWERWAAELLESHLSFPVLSYYRSQHENQSWVGALTTILDTTALLLASGENRDRYQARLTFAMARHAAVDLAPLHPWPLPDTSERLSQAELSRLWDLLRAVGQPLPDTTIATQTLAELRGLYEPFVKVLAMHYEFVLPAFLPLQASVDNWQTSPWLPRSPGLTDLPASHVEQDHF